MTLKMGGLKMQDLKMEDKFGVKPEGGKCRTEKFRTRKWRTGNCRIKYLRGKCISNVSNKWKKRKLKVRLFNFANIVPVIRRRVERRLHTEVAEVTGLGVTVRKSGKVRDRVNTAANPQHDEPAAYPHGTTEG